jgi:hypothetical protein
MADVVKLVAGPRVYLCDDCTVIALSICIGDPALHPSVADALVDGVDHAEPRLPDDRAAAVLDAAVALGPADETRLRRIAALRAGRTPPQP